MKVTGPYWVDFRELIAQRGVVLLQRRHARVLARLNLER